MGYKIKQYEPLPRTNLWGDVAKFNSLFDHLFVSPVTPWANNENELLNSGWIMPVDIHESKDNVVVRVDLPGTNKEDIDITVQDNVLTIRGERKQEVKQKEHDILREERVYGAFSRTFRLPAEVAQEKVSAEYRDGVLSLTLPKKEEAKPKQIKVAIK